VGIATKPGKRVGWFEGAAGHVEEGGEKGQEKGNAQKKQGVGLKKSRQHEIGKGTPPPRAVTRKRALSGIPTRRGQSR